MPRTLPAALTSAMDDAVFKAYIAIGRRNYTGTPPASLASYTTLITKILYYKYDGLKLTVKYASANLPADDGLIVGNKYFLERGVTIAGVNHTIKSASLRFDDYSITKQIVTAQFSLFSNDEKPAAVAGNNTYTNVLTALNPNAYYLGTVDFKTTPENTAHWGYKFYPAGKQVSLKSYASLLPLIKQKYLIEAVDNSDDTNEDEVQFFHLQSPVSSLQFSIVSSYGSVWRDICWSPELELFVMVGKKVSGGVGQILTSPDGSTWTSRTCPDVYWNAVAWSPQLALFVAIGASATYATSPDGITWTSRTLPSANTWKSIAWSPTLSLFVAVQVISATNTVYTSPDGINWTNRTSPQAAWQRVTWSPEKSLFVVVGQRTSTYSIMTSPDGVNWTGRHTTNAIYYGVCWSAELGLFVAVGTRTAIYNLATSSNGTTWTDANMPTDTIWETVAWSPDHSTLVALASTGTDNRRAKSTNGTTWTTDTDSSANMAWKSLAYAPTLELFAGCADDDSTVINGIIRSAPTTIPDHAITQGDITLLKNAPTQQFVWRDQTDSIHNSGLDSSLLHNLGYLESTDSPPASYQNADRAHATVGIHLKYKTGDIFTLKINANQTATYLAHVTEILDPDAEIGWRTEIDLIERFANTNAGAMPSTIERVASYTPLVTTNFNGNLDTTVNNLQAFAERVDDLDVLTTAEADALYAPIAKGVTNGDSHNHVGGDGAAITIPLIIAMHGNDGTVAASPGVAYATPGLSGIQAAVEYTMVTPLPGTMKNLYIRTSGTQPASGSLVATLRKGGVDTALTITIAAGSGAGTYSDTTHSVSLAAADLVDIRFANNASAASCLLRSITMEFDINNV